jgi:plasmid stabilization system protein ParE
VRVRWLTGAASSLRAVHARIALDNPAAARRVVQRIRASVARLRTFPASGRAGQVPGTMELVIDGLPYIVVYRTSEKEVQILRVFHTATDWPRLLQ